VDEETFTLIDMLVQKTWELDKVGIGRDAEGLDKLGFFKVKVTKIQRIENLPLYEHYAQYQQRLLHEAAEGENTMTVMPSFTLNSCFFICVCVHHPLPLSNDDNDNIFGFSKNVSDPCNHA